MQGAAHKIDFLAAIQHVRPSPTAVLATELLGQQDRRLNKELLDDKTPSGLRKHFTRTVTLGFDIPFYPLIEKDVRLHAICFHKALQSCPLYSCRLAVQGWAARIE